METIDSFGSIDIWYRRIIKSVISNGVHAQIHVLFYDQGHSILNLGSKFMFFGKGYNCMTLSCQKKPANNIYITRQIITPQNIKNTK